MKRKNRHHYRQVREVAPPNKCKPCVFTASPFQIVTQSYKENCDFTIFERVKKEIYTNEIFDFLGDLYSPQACKDLLKNEMLFSVVYHFIIEIITLKKTILSLKPPLKNYAN